MDLNVKSKLTVSKELHRIKLLVESRSFSRPMGLIVTHRT
jgi:hypothetical protein